MQQLPERNAEENVLRRPHVVPGGHCTYLITPTYRAHRAVRDTSKFVTRPRVRCSYRPGHYSFPRCPRIHAGTFRRPRVARPTCSPPPGPYEGFILISLPLPTLIFSVAHRSTRSRPKLRKSTGPMLQRSLRNVHSQIRAGERARVRATSTLVKLRNSGFLLQLVALLSSAPFGRILG